LKKATSGDAPALAAEQGGWLGAKVPGCVHLDLMAAGAIRDPYYGLNEMDVQWVEEAHWLYRRNFRCEAQMLAQERIDLVCEGLDTFATLYLNGLPIGQADNMFCTWRWDVTGVLREGENELLVLFGSPRRVCDELERTHGKLPAVEYGARVYARKEQCASGWDWAPRLNSCGIWRPIRLEAYSTGRIADVWALVDWTDMQKPVVQLQVELEALTDGKAELTAELKGPGPSQSAKLKGDLKAGTNVLHTRIKVKNPALWWPAGYGEQNLYELTVSGTVNGQALTDASTTLGLRRVELHREKDEEGESFVIRINGTPIFCKGANWAPADCFLPRLTRRRYGELVEKAVAANMNMLRVCGVGIYESDEFYDACDRLGVMVWQGFPFACAAYPDELDWFCKSVRTEAEQNVRRLRGHPSLVLWCGNNENHWGFHDWWPELKRFHGEKIYHRILPEVCAELDPSRPYWPGSPYGGEHPNDPAQGDQHFWKVWMSWADPDEYREFNGRFVSEFGLQAPPALETIRTYIPSGARHMQSPVMEHHEKEQLGTERLYRYLAAYFRVPREFEDTVYLMQLMQGEAIKTGVEHWRSRKFLTGGALFWSFNDCWPVTSWSCLDSELRPKALYHYAKRFFAPLLAAIHERNGRVTVTVVNDRAREFRGRIVWGLGKLDGQDVWVEEEQIVVPANGVLEALSKDQAELRLSDRTSEYLWCRLMAGEKEVGRNTHLFSRPKHIAFPRPGFELEVEETGRRAFNVRLQSPVFAKGVWLRTEGIEVQFQENYFDTLPDLPVTVKAVPPRDLAAGELKRRLSIRTVADAQGQA